MSSQTKKWKKGTAATMNELASQQGWDPKRVKHALVGLTWEGELTPTHRNKVIQQLAPLQVQLGEEDMWDSFRLWLLLFSTVVRVHDVLQADLSPERAKQVATVIVTLCWYAMAGDTWWLPDWVTHSGRNVRTVQSIFMAQLEVMINSRGQRVASDGL